MAARYAASASTGCPVARSNTPRLLWAFAWLGIDGDRTPVRGDRRLQPVVRLEDDAEVAAPVRLIGREREAALDERERFVVAPLLMREHAGVVQRTGMIGCGLEHAAVQLVGLGELLVLLQEDRERDRLLERQLTRR